MESDRRLDLRRHFLHRQRDGSLLQVEADTRLFQGNSPRDLFNSGILTGTIRLAVGVSHWECHPAGDEMLYLLSGGLRLELTGADENEAQNLTPGDAIVIPAGRWHRAVVDTPSDVLFMTPLTNSQVR